MNQAVLEINKNKSSKDPLLQPFLLKGLKLRNRIISTSHASNVDDGGLPLERYVRYHEEKARGGLALTMIGGSAMTSPDSNWGGGQLDLSNDLVVPHFANLAERVHSHGAAVMCQISHLGRRGTSFAGNWLPTVAPSRVRERLHRDIPKEMDDADIKRIVQDYANAARRCRDGGLDGVETLTGGHLIGQFLSPRTNKRTDSFGGSLENRARFGLMVHEAVRRAVGDDFIVGIRLAIDEGGDEGYNLGECLGTARLFEREGHVDFFNCIFGRMDTEKTLSEHNMPGMFIQSAPFLAEVGQFRNETKLPVFHAAGIRDVATARYAIAEGLVDLIGMTRAHIADPHMVNKLLAGEEERIRPCVGASYCLYKSPFCVHNPATGREVSLSHTIEKAKVPKRFVVVGGGPAGLEAARVARERGHEVTLFEAARRLGGQIVLASSAKARRDLIGIIDWRVSELDRLGVEVRLNTFADGEAVMAEKPDVVVVATGGTPDADWVDGAEYCDTVWDILSGSTPVKDDVLIYDGTGRQAAASCALHLARKGCKVQIATVDDAIGIEMPPQDRTGFRKGLAEYDVPIINQAQLVRVERKGEKIAAILRIDLTEKEIEVVASQLIVEFGTAPFDEIYHELRRHSSNAGVTEISLLVDGTDSSAENTDKSAGFELHRIGDAISSRDIHSAVYDAYRICSKL